MKTPVTDLVGCQFPIFAFSHCRDVVAAVTQAGGVGMLGALFFTPEQLELELRWLDEHCGGKPYGVDIVMAASYAGDDMDELAARIPAGHRDFVQSLADRFRLPPLPEGESAQGERGLTHQGARSQLDVVLDHDVRLVANALGAPPDDVVERVHDAGVLVAGLVGNVRQAERQVAQGVDIVIAQGYEAGGHTGEIASMVLVPEVVDAVAPTPVLAAGGIGDGRQVAAAMALGAQGVWTGSIWLTVAEAETDDVVVEKLLHASSSDTIRTRVVSGKPLRQLRTPFLEALSAPGAPAPLPMPLQSILVADARARIERHKVPELMTVSVGQIVGRMNQVRKARDVIYDLVDGYLDSVQALHTQITDQTTS